MVFGSFTHKGIVQSGSTSFSPTTLSGCILWLAPTSITLGTTMGSTGTTPPAVTLSGTLTASIPIRIEITTGGARGTALFRWSLNSGSTWEATGVTTAASVALGSTGISAGFAVGTYSTNNVYISLAATWSDLSGNANHVIQGASNQMPTVLYNTVLGGTAVKFDGSNDILSKASGGLTGDADHTIFARVDFQTASSFRGFATIGTAGTANLGATSAVGASSTTAWYGGAGFSNPQGTTLTASTAYTIGKTHASGNDQGYLGASTNGSPTANTYALVNGFIVGSYGSNGGYTASAIRSVVAYNRALDAGEITQLVGYLDAA